MNAAENEVSHEAGFVPGAEVRYAGQGSPGPPVSLELRILAPYLLALLRSTLCCFPGDQGVEEMLL